MGLRRASDRPQTRNDSGELGRTRGESGRASHGPQLCGKHYRRIIIIITLEQRARALEQRARALEQRARALEQRARALEQRARASEQRARALEHYYHYYYGPGPPTTAEVCRGVPRCAEVCRGLPRSAEVRRGRQWSAVLLYTFAMC